ncbi:SOS response regulatory protein OraA/RecX, interacts with RecA [Ruminococcaceae bacterium YRB3002]|nr:SOS response regulatory protein OraA/RecX, interacts with RecA [Ruminococcaceae bacterium YRB3002]
MNGQDIQYREVLEAAVRHIGIATYSSGKIRSYLVNKGFPEEIVSQVVAELIDRQYIDDRKASRKVLVSRSGKKQESRDYMRQRLLAAGIDEGIAEDIVSSLPADSDTCLSLFRSLGVDSDTDENRETMIRIASQRGYTYETASEAYRRWSEEL